MLSYLFSKIVLVVDILDYIHHTDSASGHDISDNAFCLFPLISEQLMIALNATKRM